VNHFHTVLYYFLILLSLLGVHVPPAEVEETKDVVDGRRLRKRSRMIKELDGLLEDNAGKSERDRSTIWRKIQKFLARNDDITNE